MLCCSPLMIRSITCNPVCRLNSGVKWWNHVSYTVIEQLWHRARVTLIKLLMPYTTTVVVICIMTLCIALWYLKALDIYPMFVISIGLYLVDLETITIDIDVAPRYILTPLKPITTIEVTFLTDHSIEILRGSTNCRCVVQLSRFILLFIAVIIKWPSYNTYNICFKFKAIFQVFYLTNTRLIPSCCCCICIRSCCCCICSRSRIGTTVTVTVTV